MGQLITDDMLSEFAVIAPRDKVGALLKRKYEGVLDRISLYMPYMPGSNDDWWADLVSKVRA